MFVPFIKTLQTSFMFSSFITKVSLFLITKLQKSNQHLIFLKKSKKMSLHTKQIIYNAWKSHLSVELLSLLLESWFFFYFGTFHFN